MQNFLIIFLLASFNFHAIASDLPSKRDQFDKIVDSVAFKTKISNTTWSYKWRGREFIFSFNPNGNISKLPS